jgi:hypothetical protein
MNSYDPTDIKAQDRAKDDIEVRARLSRDTEESDLKWLMGSKRGRRIVWRLLDRAGVFRISFSTNSMQMAFAEGNRNFGQYILSQIHATCPDLYPVMIKESLNDARNDDASRNDH